MCIIGTIPLTLKRNVKTFIKTFSNNTPCAISYLQVFDKQLKFTMQMFGGYQSLVIADPLVADGNWHNATVTVSGKEMVVLLPSVLTRPCILGPISTKLFKIKIKLRNSFSA